MTRVRIATRGSDLALAQANYIAGRLRNELGAETELLVLKTTGDRILDVPLAQIGGKGLFVKEIEEALLQDRADVAVHSAKDLPAVLADGLQLAAFPERADPRDALCMGRAEGSVEALPEGARVGTGSTRRASQLLAQRPDLEIVPLRGNVPTRLSKIESENLAGVILACAGLDRLGLDGSITQRISTDILLPAVCQGMLALEARKGDPILDQLAALDVPDNAVSVAAERSFLLHLEGDCTVPLACFCEHTSGSLIRLRGLVSTIDGRNIARAELSGSREDAERLGEELAARVVAEGGGDILAELRQQAQAPSNPGIPPTPTTDSGADP